MRTDEKNKIINIKPTLHRFLDISPLGSTVLADWHSRREVLVILQKYLQSVVDDASCKPYGCGKNAERESRGEL